MAERSRWCSSSCATDSVAAQNSGHTRTATNVAGHRGLAIPLTWVYGKEGKVYFDVIADGRWTIKVTQTTPPVKQVPVKYQASYSIPTTPFEFTGNVTVSYTHKGKANFIVTALDAESGKPLWDIQLGGAVRGIPISYPVDGKQYV